jgi:hypothetical protein
MPPSLVLFSLNISGYAREARTMPRIAKVKSLDSFRIRRDFPREFGDGEGMGAGWEPDGEREKGGYPLGFHDWPLERRNAWFAGFNLGHARRKRSRR